MTIEEVTEKFVKLSIKDFEKWCTDNVLLKNGDGSPWNTETHRGFYLSQLSLSEDDPDFNVYLVTIRHHVKEHLYSNKYSNRYKLREVNEDYNKSLYGDDCWSDALAPVPIITISQHYLDSHFVMDDPNSLNHGV